MVGLGSRITRKYALARLLFSNFTATALQRVIEALQERSNHYSQRHARIESLD
jgi:hypothetical protein